MYFVFTRIPGESYCRRLMHVSVVLCLFCFFVLCRIFSLCHRHKIAAFTTVLQMSILMRLDLMLAVKVL